MTTYQLDTSCHIFDVNRANARSERTKRTHEANARSERTKRTHEANARSERTKRTHEANARSEANAVRWPDFVIIMCSMVTVNRNTGFRHRLPTWIVTWIKQMFVERILWMYQYWQRSERVMTVNKEEWLHYAYQSTLTVSEIVAGAR